MGQELFRLGENNGDARMERNGELELLRGSLSSWAPRGAQPFVVFDVGANVGSYSRRVLEEAGRAGRAVELHTFEPSPFCVEKLRGVFLGNGAVRVVAAAASDHEGEATLFGGGGGDSLASLVPRSVHQDGEVESMRVPLIRLDAYMESRGVGQVDLLKLDVEGAEYPALLGLGSRLDPDKIDIVQFEYGGTTLDAGYTLMKIYGLLSGKGYLLAKLFPHGPELRPFKPWMENFSYANYVALSPRWLAPGNRGLE